MLCSTDRQFHLFQRKDLGKQPVNASNLGISLPEGMTVVAVDGVTQSGAFASESGTPQSSPMKSSTGQVTNDHSDIPSCSSSTQDSSAKPVGLDDEYFFPGAIKDANSLDWGLSNVDGQSKQLKRPDGSLKRVRPSAANDIIVLDLPPNLIEEAEKKLRIHHRGFQCAVCFKTRETREVGEVECNDDTLFIRLQFVLACHCSYLSTPSVDGAAPIYMQNLWEILRQREKSAR